MDWNYIKTGKVQDYENFLYQQMYLLKQTSVPI